MELLLGNSVVSEIEAECFEAMKEIESAGLKAPLIHVFQFGNDSSSLVYVKRIAKNCEKFGIKFEHLIFEDADEFRKKLAESCNSQEINAVMVQQPLPGGLAAHIDEIPFVKDVEGVTTASLGRLFKGEPCLIPCTAQAVMEILDFYDIPLAGKKVAVVGRSNIVGKPLAVLLLNKNATVTLCHSKTKNLSAELKNADVVAIAIGRANFVGSDSVNENSIVIDVGTNFVNGKLVGDVNFDEVQGKASKITPVPGGVGVVTNALLIRNIISAYKMQH